MKVNFRKTGGYAPVFEGCEIELDKLPPQEAAQLKDLVLSSKILQQTGKRQEAARHVLLYTFDVEDQGQQNKVTFDQLSVPPEVQPLLDFLLERSKDLMPDL